VLLLLLPILYSESVDTGASLYIPWLALHIAVLAACVWAVVQSVRLMRAEGQHL
jgi:hypothetical protein